MAILPLFKKNWLMCGLALLAVSIMTTAFMPHPIEKAPSGSYFITGPLGQAISNNTKVKLTRAYQAQFGQAAKIKKIEYVKYKGSNFLAIQSAGKGSPTLAIKLRAVEGKWVIGLNAATNTCTGNPCSWCYFTSTNGCICNTEGTCNHTVSSLKNYGDMVEVLGIS